MKLIDADELDRVIMELNTVRGYKITRYEYKLISNVLFEFPTIKKLPIVKDGERNIEVLNRIFELYFPDMVFESFDNVRGFKYHLIFDKVWLEKKYKNRGDDNAE